MGLSEFLPIVYAFHEKDGIYTLVIQPRDTKFEQMIETNM
jgi:hypothetical protein